MQKIVRKLFNTIGQKNRSLEIRRREKATISEIDKLFELVLEWCGGGESKSQLKQDIFALIINRFKKDGFFVEFGATNGIDLSNTYLLEKYYGWRGVLAEPAKMWHSSLTKNRTCAIETNCVWSKSGEILSFDMVAEGEYSTISTFSESDLHSEIRKNKITYDVTTISLLDMLNKHKAPKKIDYISIDTEGSEFDILERFDFSSYRFNVITIEHNYTANRERIKDLLYANGYRRVFDNLSKWDDWYIDNNQQIIDESGV